MQGFRKLFNEMILGVFTFEDTVKIDSDEGYEFNREFELKLIEQLKSHSSNNSKIEWIEQKYSRETRAYIYNNYVTIIATWGKFSLSQKVESEGWFVVLVTFSFISVMGVIHEPPLTQLFSLMIYISVYLYIYITFKSNLKSKWYRTIGYVEGAIGSI